MFRKTLLTLISSAAALVLLSVQPAVAQEESGDNGARATSQSRETPRGDRAAPGGRQSRRGAAAASPEADKAAAQGFLTAAAVDCRVSEATLLGVTAEQHSTYEVVCAEGPGYLVVGSTPPQTFNCLELAGQAETSRLRDPTADVGQQCTLPVNLDPLPVLTTFARQAGIDCTVDQAAAIGKSRAGALIFEIGCAGRDGYWIEKSEGSWKASPCWALSVQGVACRYSTSPESLGAWSTVLAGTDAAACDVQQARRVGRDAQSLTVYEVKCGAGDGYFARVGDDYKAQRVQACATPEAAAVAGGCTLSPSATVPANE